MLRRTYDLGHGRVLFFRRDSAQRIANTTTTTSTTTAIRRIMASNMAQVVSQVDDLMARSLQRMPGEYRAPFQAGSVRGGCHHHGLGKRVSAARTRP